MFHDTITIVRPVKTTDRYGSDELDYDQGTRNIVEHVSVQPRSSTEQNTDARDMVITAWRIFTPPGADPRIQHDDRFGEYGTEDRTRHRALGRAVSST